MSYLPTIIEQGLTPSVVEQIYDPTTGETVTYMKYTRGRGLCAIRKLVQSTSEVEGKAVSTTREYCPESGRLTFKFDFDQRTTYNYVERLV